MKMSQIRILIAEGDRSLAQRMANYLRDSGFDVKTLTEPHLIQKALLEWRPQFIFIDLLFPGFNAIECLKFLKMRKRMGEKGTHVVVMSGHNHEMNVRSCLESGADDFIVKPFQLIDILQRLSLLTQVKKYNFSAISAQNQEKVKRYFDMVNLIVKAANQNKPVCQLRLDLIQMISMALKAVRTSVIEVGPEKKSAAVTRSSDDPSLDHFKLDLNKYPELQYVLRTEKPLFVESLEKHQSLSFVKHEVKSIQFDSMMVLPLHRGKKLVACLSIRMPSNCKKLSMLDIKMAEITAQVLAMTWKFPQEASQKKAA